MLRMNRTAESAHIESEEVAAVKVRNTGDSAMRVRKTIIEDLRVLRSVERSEFHIKPSIVGWFRLTIVIVIAVVVALPAGLRHSLSVVQEIPYGVAKQKARDADPNQRSRI